MLPEVQGELRLRSVERTSAAPLRSWRPDDDMPESRDLGSTDFLDVVMALNRETAVDVRESGYPTARTRASSANRIAGTMRGV